MKAEAQSFAQIVENDKYLVIPFFQRGYVWGKDNWQELLENLLGDNEHFLGSVIFRAYSNEHGELVWSVIDGQQRLTTLSVLFDVCCKILSLATTSANNGWDQFEHKRQSLLFFDSHQGHVLKLRHSRIDVGSYEIAICERTDQHVYSRKIQECSSYFASELNGDLCKAERIFNILKGNKEILVRILLGDGDREQAIFDTINSAGVRLTAADTIKNLLFQRVIDLAGEDGHAEIEKMYDDYWDAIFNGEAQDYWYQIHSQGRINRITLEMLLHCVAVVEGFYDPNRHSASDLSDCYKQFICDKPLSDLKAFIHRIAKYAKCYREFFRDEDAGHLYGFSDVCDRTLNILRACDTSTFDPLILKLVYDSSQLGNGIESESFIQSLDGIAKYVLLHVVCEESTKNFNKECAMVISGAKCIDEYLSEKMTAGKINNENVRVGLRRIKHNRIARCILFWLELKRRACNPVDIKKLPDTMSLEHLMPQKWQEYWPVSLPPVVDAETGVPLDRPDVAELRTKAVYEIGNMALVNQKLNTSIRNHTMREKVLGNGNNKPGIGALSDMLYTKDVVTLVNENNYLWNEKTIRDRTNELTEEFLSVWGVGDMPHAVSSQGTQTPEAQSIEMAMSQESEIVNAEPHESQIITESSQVQEGDAELKIGKMAKTIFPVLFAENRMTDDDVNFLLSDAARIQFKTQGNKVLKETTGDVDADAKDAKGVKRFYTNILLEHGGKRYLLTSQWFANGKPPLSAWFAEHGISKERVVELCG